MCRKNLRKVKGYHGDEIKVNKVGKSGFSVSTVDFNKYSLADESCRFLYIFLQ